MNFSIDGKILVRVIFEIIFFIIVSSIMGTFFVLFGFCMGINIPSSNLWGRSLLTVEFII